MRENSPPETDDTLKAFHSLSYEFIRNRLDSEDDKFFNRTSIFLTANTFQLFLYGAAKFAENIYLTICLSAFFLVLSIIWMLVGIQSRNFLNMLFGHPNLQSHPIMQLAVRKKALFSFLSTINLIGIALPGLFTLLWLSLFVISISTVAQVP